MSTVLTFQVPNGRWAYAVSPTRLSVGGMDFLNRDDALEAAKRVIEREGWEPLPPPGEATPPPRTLETASTTGTVTIAKGITLPWAAPTLRLVGDDE